MQNKHTIWADIKEKATEVMRLSFNTSPATKSDPHLFPEKVSRQFWHKPLACAAPAQQHGILINSGDA